MTTHPDLLERCEQAVRVLRDILKNGDLQAGYAVAVELLEDLEAERTRPTPLLPRFPVVVQMAVRTSAHGWCSEDRWLEHTLMLPFPPSPNLTVIDGTFEVTIDEGIIWNTETGRFVCNVDDDVQIPLALRRGETPPDLATILANYVEDGWVLRESWPTIENVT